MVVTLKLKPDAPALEYYSRAELTALANSMIVNFLPGDEIVHIGPVSPSDKSKKWQETDAYGIYVGGLKSYNGTKWYE